MVLKFYDYINEVRRDLQFSYLKKLMADLGYDYAFTNPDHKFYKTVIDRDGNPHRLLLVTHKHHTGGTVDAAAFTQMKKNLIDEYQYTGNIDLFNKVDWDYIGTVNPLKSGMLGDIDMETGLDKATAESLKDIEVGDQLFKNVWVITNKDGEHNLCKSPEDKRPLLDRWYPLYKASKKLGGKMCLGYAVDDMDAPDFGDNLFEIKEDGTLGNTYRVDYVIESLKKS